MPLCDIVPMLSKDLIPSVDSTQAAVSLFPAHPEHEELVHLFVFIVVVICSLFVLPSLNTITQVIRQRV